MKAYFLEDGTLVIQPQKVVECIAVEAWLSSINKPLPEKLMVCVGLPKKKPKKHKKKTPKKPGFLEM